MASIDARIVRRGGHRSVGDGTSVGQLAKAGSPLLGSRVSASSSSTTPMVVWAMHRRLENNRSGFGVAREALHVVPSGRDGDELQEQNIL